MKEAVESIPVPKFLWWIVEKVLVLFFVAAVASFLFAMFWIFMLTLNQARLSKQLETINSTLKKTNVELKKLRDEMP